MSNDENRIDDYGRGSVTLMLETDRSLVLKDLVGIHDDSIFSKDVDGSKLLQIAICGQQQRASARLNKQAARALVDALGVWIETGWILGAEPELAALPLKALSLSARIERSLKDENVEHVGQLAKLPIRELIGIPNIGRASVFEICINYYEAAHKERLYLPKQVYREPYAHKLVFDAIDACPQNSCVHDVMRQLKHYIPHLQKYGNVWAELAVTERNVSEAEKLLTKARDEFDQRAKEKLREAQQQIERALK